MTFDDFRNLVSGIDSEKGTDSELLNELEVEIHFTKGDPIKCGLENIRLLEGKFVIAASEMIGRGDPRAWNKDWDKDFERQYIEQRETHRQTEQDEIDKLWAMLEAGSAETVSIQPPPRQQPAPEPAPLREPGQARIVSAPPEDIPEPVEAEPAADDLDDIAEDDIMAHIPPSGL